MPKFLLQAKLTAMPVLRRKVMPKAKLEAERRLVPMVELGAELVAALRVVLRAELKVALKVVPMVVLGAELRARLKIVLEAEPMVTPKARLESKIRAALLIGSKTFRQALMKME